MGHIDSETKHETQYHNWTIQAIRVLEMMHNIIKLLTTKTFMHTLECDKT